MDVLTRVLSRPTAKPYRTRDVEANEKPFLNEQGMVDFSPNDIENPKNWSFARRWYITIVCVMLVFNATFASSSPSACVVGISEHFNVSVEAAGLVTTLFLLGYVAGPLAWAPLSEFYGRRWIFYWTFLLYIAFNFLCAFANNFAALLIGRFLTGTFVSSALSNAPGVLVDLFNPFDRGNGMAIFSMLTFVGPAVGPVISGFFELKTDWRWSFYCLLWLGGATAVFMFTVPETLPSVVLVNKAKRIRALKIPGYENVKAPAEANDRRLKSIFAVALTRPWKILLDPIALLIAIYMSVVYMVVYMLFTLYPIVFQQMRGWNAGVGELPLLGTAVGAFVGGAYVFWDTSKQVKKAKSGYKAVPEDRLKVAIMGGILFPVSIFWFAWSGQYNSVHWIVPTLAGVFVDAAVLLIFVAYLNYLSDTYLMFTASAIAGNTIMRSAAGAAAPLFTQYMFNALGVGGGGSLIGGVGVLLAIIPFAFMRYAPALRQRSKFAPTPPPKPVEAPQEKDVQQDRRIAASGPPSTIDLHDDSASVKDKQEDKDGEE